MADQRRSSQIRDEIPREVTAEESRHGASGLPPGAMLVVVAANVLFFPLWTPRIDQPGGHVPSLLSS